MHLGQISFSDIDIPMEPGAVTLIGVAGKIGEGAGTGNRMKIGLVEADDILIKNGVSERLLTDLDFPTWSPAVSVIGRKL